MTKRKPKNPKPKTTQPAAPVQPVPLVPPPSKKQCLSMCHDLHCLQCEGHSTLHEGMYPVEGFFCGVARWSDVEETGRRVRGDS